MSCNGCRVLRKGCSDNCMLRQCLQWMEDPQAQAHATVFVAKFFGRAGLFSFINGVSESQRPGLLLSGKWEVCQAAIETVLHGGALEPLPEYSRDNHYVREHQVRVEQRQSTKKKRPNFAVDDDVANFQLPDLNLCLTSAAGLTSRTKRRDCRAATPSVED